VQKNDNPFALLSRQERNSTQGGVVRLVMVPGVARRPTGEQS
jgi:hypothetical protein